MLKNSVLSLLILVLAVGCTGLRTRRDIETQKQSRVGQAPSQVPGAPAEEETMSEESPQPFGTKETRLPKIGLILGPGGVKSFAHTGVIRELQKAKIPIHAVVGMEWGAVVAALFAQNGLIHEVEWKLFKLQQKDWQERGFFSSGIEPQSVDKLQTFFKESFGKERIEQAKIPFACPTLSLVSGVVAWQRRGSFKDAMAKCLPYPPLFKATQPWMAGAFSLAESVALLKDSGAEVIVFVNVLGEGTVLKEQDLMDNYSAALLWQELRRYLNAEQKNVDEFIEVVTRSQSLYDFDSRNLLVVAGEQAGASLVRRLSEKYGF